MAYNRAAILETCFECFGTNFIKKEMVKYKGKQYCKRCKQIIVVEEEERKVRTIISNLDYKKELRRSIGLQ